MPVEKAAALPTRDFKQEVEADLEKKTGIPRESFKTFAIALPAPVYDAFCKAERKLAHSLSIDIELKAGNRILVWEALA